MSRCGLASVAKQHGNCALQNRYSRAAKDWGWREFVTLTSLFDQDAGFLVHDTVVFSAEVTGGVHAKQPPPAVLLCACGMHTCAAPARQHCEHVSLRAVPQRVLSTLSQRLAQVLVLKEQTDIQEIAVTPLSLADEVAEALQSAPAAEQGTSLSTCPPPAVPPADRSAGPAAQGKKIKFTWRIENFMAFKEIMETRKIFSK